MQKKKELVREELYGELGRNFNFTQGDLESNRAGFVTWRQKQIKWREVYHVLYSILFLAIGYLSIAAFGQLFEDNTEMKSNIFWFMSVFSLVITSLIVLGFGLIPLFYDLLTGRVTSIVGEPRIEIHSIPKRGNTPHFVIGKLKQRLGRNSKLMLKSCPYRVYFMPKSRRIISVEEVLPNES